MRQHVFAFLVAFAVWVSGNTLFGMMPASARTGGIGMGCEPRTEVVWNNQCGTHPSCAGFCSKFTFYTKRCEELSGLNCSERDGTVQYTHEKFYCPLGGMAAHVQVLASTTTPGGGIHTRPVRRGNKAGRFGSV